MHNNIFFLMVKQIWLKIMILITEDRLCIITGVTITIILRSITSSLPAFAAYVLLQAIRFLSTHWWITPSGISA